MDWKKAGALAVLVGVLGAGNVNVQGSEIVVRTFNNYRVPEADMRDAQAMAAGTLRAAGISVTWIDCWYGDRRPLDAPARCREDVGRDLVLRLQRAGTETRDRYISLGFSLVMPEGTPFLATVYADLAEGVARRAGVATRAVLARAIAHEIGHLLLNTNTHPKAGLMRAAWSQRELRRNAAQDWEFRQSEAESMRAAIAHRHRHDHRRLGD